jgi:hypothetical protein
VTFQLCAASAIFCLAPTSRDGFSGRQQPYAAASSLNISVQAGGPETKSNASGVDDAKVLDRAGHHRRESAKRKYDFG